MAAVVYVGFSWIRPQLEATGQTSAELKACREGVPTAHSAIIVDVTDSFNADQKELVRVIVRTTQRDLPVGGRVSIYTLGQEEFAPQLIASECRPKIAEEANPLTEGTSTIRLTWRNFEHVLNKPLNTAMSAEEAKASPIIEALQVVRDRPDFRAGIERRKIILVSDLLHKSSRLSLYSVPALNEVLKNSSVSPIELDLRGISVELALIRRSVNARQGSDQFQSFWRRLFTEAGAVTSCHPASQGCPLT